jgi:hypothetical protein
MEELKYLFCTGTSVTELPILPKLVQLFCQYCTSFTSIPPMTNLELLYCEGCTALTSLPLLPKLTELSCRDCTDLTTVPLFPALEKLFCENCTSLTEVFESPTLKELHCNGCKWIVQCSDYNSNIKSLRTCQAIVKRKLIGRKLDKLIPVITEIYYSPGCKGESIARQSFSNLLHSSFEQEEC